MGENGSWRRPDPASGGRQRAGLAERLRRSRDFGHDEAVTPGNGGHHARRDARPARDRTRPDDFARAPKLDPAIFRTGLKRERLPAMLAKNRISRRLEFLHEPQIGCGPNGSIRHIRP